MTTNHVTIKSMVHIDNQADVNLHQSGDKEILVDFRAIILQNPNNKQTNSLHEQK